MSIIKKLRSFILEEKDVTSMLDAINKHHSSCKYILGNCGWADQRSMWFVLFYTTDKDYGRIVKKLLKVGTLRPDVRPGGMVDIIFERT